MPARRSLARQAFRANAGARGTPRELAVRYLTKGTGSPSVDKFLTASAVTAIVAALLVIFSPPMIEKKSKKKYHLPQKCYMRMLLYVAITFGITLGLCYLPFFN